MLITISSPSANASVSCAAGASGTFSIVMMDAMPAHAQPHVALADPLPAAQVALTVTVPGQSAAVEVQNVLVGRSTWNCASFPTSLAGKTGCKLTATLTNSTGGSTSASVQNVSFSGPIPVPPVPPGPPPATAV